MQNVRKTDLVAVANQRSPTQMAFLATASLILLLCPSLIAGNVTNVGHRRVNAGSLPQRSPTQSLGRLASGKHLLLVLTLDGTLSAYDKYSGAFHWQTMELQGGHPIIHGSGASNIGEGGPLYIFEPVGPASTFVYLPDGGIQKLPVTLKGLVQQSPVRWPDGTFFIGNKFTDFYALDLASGKIVYRYEHGPGLTCPSEEVTRAFAGDSPTLLLIAKSVYTLACFGPSSDFISPAWNITYSEFGGFVNPFREGASVGVRRSGDSLPPEDEVEVYSSFNGVVIARDAKTKQVMWVRKLKHTATAFFSLTSPQDSGDGERDALGPVLRPISIKAAPFSSSSTSLLDPSVEMLVNLGSIGGTFYVLGSDRFPMYQSIPYVGGDEDDEYGRIGNHHNASVSDRLEIAPFAKTSIAHSPCIPGSPGFPDCLLGRGQVAQILRPIPLLRGTDQGTQYWPVARPIVVAIAFILAGSLWMLWHRLRHRPSRTVTSHPSIAPPPPGFEEISISSADILYSAQSDTSTDAHRHPHPHPRSFLVSDQVIGYGSHGTVVFRGTYDGRPVAVKRMLIDFYDVAGHEVRLLQHSDHHPNVVRYYCREVTEKFAYIVLELCIGSLADLIESPAGSAVTDMQVSLNELRPKLLADPQALLRQVASGLAHLHALSLVHRDIKPHNILVTPQGRLVLSDFGVSKKLAEDQTSFNPTVAAGTVGWRAPECILTAESMSLSATQSAESQTQVKVSRSLDIFALGCVFYYVLSGGEHPFGGRLEREMNIVKNAADLSRLRSQPEAADLIQSMLSRRPERRPNCQAVLAHPYFWSAQRQITFLLDVSDRFEFEDRLPSSEILRRLESRRTIIFEGSLVWHKLIDAAVWADLCNYRKYNPHSARDLLRALRNKRNHFHELTPDLRRILGETPEAFMKYFLERFPRLLIEIYRLVKGTSMHKDNPFASVYFNNN